MRVVCKAAPALGFLRVVVAYGDGVAVCGDGTDDAPALAQADVSVAMNSGTQVAKEAGNLIALDRDSHLTVR